MAQENLALVSLAEVKCQAPLHGFVWTSLYLFEEVLVRVLLSAASRVNPASTTRHSSDFHEDGLFSGVTYYVPRALLSGTHKPSLRRFSPGERNPFVSKQINSIGYLKKI